MRGYLAGDGAQRDADGYFWIMGRIDDVLNVSGHRLGTMEVESALVAHELVAEAAVVGRPDDTTGEAVVAFGARARGPRAKRRRPSPSSCATGGQGDRPHRQGHPLRRQPPKTRSGKIMRRLLRVVAKGEEITQDVSTLENPAILDQWPSRCRSDAFRSARRPSASWTKRRRHGGAPRGEQTPVTVSVTGVFVFRSPSTWSPRSEPQQFRSCRLALMLSTILVWAGSWIAMKLIVPYIGPFDSWRCAM